MKLRFLYTLGLLLCLSNFASPNECSRHCPLAAWPVTPSTAPAASATEPAAAAATQTASGQGESNSPTLIKLLYI
jgi:hypothetical protein